jgi:hypothetical protein
MGETMPVFNQDARSKWWRIGGCLLIGLFVASLDHFILSVALPSLSKDLGSPARISPWFPVGRWPFS